MPSAHDLEPMVGGRLEQICLDPFGVQFKFEQWWLAVEHRIEHIEPDGTRYCYDCAANQGPPLMLHRLLARSVSAIERNDLFFRLRFDGGDTLIIHTDLGPYECGSLRRANVETAIFVF